jgi:type IV fimbrial biogenesis protein FimT
MVALTIVAIITTLGVPAMRSYIDNQRIKTTSFELMSTLMYARSEAIKRNANIDVKANAGGWQDGWTVEDAGGDVLREQSQMKSVTIASGSTTITYNREGRLAPGGNVTFSLNVSPDTGDIVKRCINLDLSGRPNAARGGDCP